MKTTLILPASQHRSRVNVKKLLIRGIIYLSSENFRIFVAIAAGLIAWWGVFADNDRLTDWGGLMFVIGLAPWAFRDTAREIRKNRLGINNI